MKRWAVVLSVGICILLVALEVSASGYDEAPTYRFVKVEKGRITATVAATGTLQAVATILVGTQVSGQISEILADFNTEVQKGDVIARIDPLSFQIQAEQAAAEVDTAEGVLMKARVTLREAEDDEQRKRKLASTGAGSAVELSKALAAKDFAAADVQTAVAMLAKSKAALKQARLNLEWTQIRSPVDGVVIQRNVEQGQTVAAELQAPTLYVIAQDLRDMQVNLSIDEADIGRVKIGQPVGFTVDTFPAREFPGKVVQIRKYPVVKENVTTYVVVVSTRNPDLVLLPGLTATANVVVAFKDDVLKVPTAALRFRPGGSPFSGPAVWIRGPGGPIEKRMHVGISDGTFTEVEGDLRQGEDVVVAAALTAGDSSRLIDRARAFSVDAASGMTNFIVAHFKRYLKVGGEIGRHWVWRYQNWLNS
jgi:HlyD family secretion protein